MEARFLRDDRAVYSIQVVAFLGSMNQSTVEAIVIEQLKPKSRTQWNSPVVFSHGLFRKVWRQIS